jgi:hypothetical protein
MIHTIYIIGILFIILGFVLLLLATTEVRKVNKEIIRQKQLSESFIKAKQNEKNTFNYKHTILN